MQINVIEFSGFSLYNGDCRNVMSTLENKVDMIFADPPYFYIYILFKGYFMRFKAIWIEYNNLFTSIFL